MKKKQTHLFLTTTNLSACIEEQKVAKILFNNSITILDGQKTQGKAKTVSIRRWALEKHTHMKISSLQGEVKKKSMLLEETVVAPFKKLYFRIT